jgi:hypothetical protein
MPDISTLLTVRQFSARHPAFPQGGLRHLIFNSEKNGLAQSGALVRLGRKILIDERVFIEWVKEEGNAVNKLSRCPSRGDRVKKR